MYAIKPRDMISPLGEVIRSASVAHGTGKAIRVDAGQCLTITDMVGGQVASLFFFEPTDMTEFFSPSHTRVAAGTHDMRRGARLYSNQRQPIAVLEDQSSDRHNMLLPACRAVSSSPGVGRSCRSNVIEALEEFHAQLVVLPDPINLFQPVEIQSDGVIAFGTAGSIRGDHSSFRALRALLAVVSSCPRSTHTPGTNETAALLVAVHAVLVDT